MMREAARISIFCKVLAQLWVRYPDLRFGQLISNFNDWLMREKNTAPFYMEDGKYLKYLEEYFEYMDEMKGK